MFIPLVLECLQALAVPLAVTSFGDCLAFPSVGFFRLFITLPVSHALQRSSVSIGPMQHLITRTHLGRYVPFPSASLCVPFALPDLAPDRTSAQSTTSGFCPAPLGVSSPFSSVSFPTCFLVPLVPSDFHCTSPAQPTRTLPRLVLLTRPISRPLFVGVPIVLCPLKLDGKALFIVDVQCYSIQLASPKSCL